MRNTTLQSFTFTPHHATSVDNRIHVIAVLGLSKMALTVIAVSIHGLGIKISDINLQANIVFNYTRMLFVTVITLHVMFYLRHSFYKNSLQ